MKKVIFIAAAVVAMSACSKVETKSVSVSEEIGFYTISQNATKGYIVHGLLEEYQNPNNEYETSLYNNTVAAEAPTARVMQVSAYNTTDINDYFISKTFKLTPANGLWHNYVEDVETPLYWPLGKNLQFLSYSSKNIAGRDDVVANWESAKKVSFDVTPEQCYQNDIVYGQTKGSNRGTAGTDGSNSSVGLPITFYHAQAWITFNIQAVGSESTKNVIDVTKIVMANVYNSGVLSFEYDETASPAKPVAKWDFFTQNPTDVEVDDAWNNVYGANKIFADPDNSKNGVQLNMLMPAQDHNEFILYYIANGVNGSVVLPFSGAFADDETWEMGKHYIYNVTISVNELTFAPTVTGWVEVKGFNPETLSI